MLITNIPRKCWCYRPEIVLWCRNPLNVKGYRTISKKQQKKFQKQMPSHTTELSNPLFISILKTCFYKLKLFKLSSFLILWKHAHGRTCNKKRKTRYFCAAYYSFNPDYLMIIGQLSYLFVLRLSVEIELKALCFF